MWAKTKYKDSGRCVNIKHVFKNTLRLLMCCVMVSEHTCFGTITQVFRYVHACVCGNYTRVYLYVCTKTFIMFIIRSVSLR